jgi:Kef-type K+ transport system membrane component KefB
MTETIFLEVSALMGITITLSLIMRALRQPLVVAYILTGIAAGPLFLNLLGGPDIPLQSFAQFGIVLLLFVVGLSLNLTAIKQVGRAVLIGSLLQFFITSFFGYWCMVVFGLPSLTAIFLAISVSFSSTIIVVKLLNDKKDAESMYGRFVIGILLVQVPIPFR